MDNQSTSPHTDLFYETLVRSYVDAPRFVERPWLAERLEASLNDPNCRFLLLTAEPGAGKTAFMAWLARCHPDWLRYFIRRDSRTPLSNGDARSFLFTVGHQLAALRPTLFRPDELELVVKQRMGELQASGKAVGIKLEDLHVSPFYKTSLKVEQDAKIVAGELEGISIKRMVAEERFLGLENLQHLALLDPAGVLSKEDPAARIVILLDALDELRYHADQVSLLKWLAECPELPPNVRFVLSSREDEALLARFRGTQQQWLSEQTITPDDANVRKDLGAYARALASEPRLKAVFATTKGVDQFVHQAVDRANGNFGYLDALGRAIDQALAREDMELLGHVLNLSQLPETLQGLYAFFLHQIKDGVRGQSVEVDDPATHQRHYLPAWPAIYRRILGVLTVAREPLTLSQIQRFGGIRAEGSYVADAVERLRQFLDREGDGYRLYHATLVEFLTAEATHHNPETQNLAVQPTEASRHLLECCWKWEELPKAPPRDYVLRYGIDHLLDRDLAVNAPSDVQALELCRRDEGRFLREAIAANGARWIENQMERLFTGYFQTRCWLAAATSLVYLRGLAETTSPLESCLVLLSEPIPIERLLSYLEGLERLVEKPLQRAIAILALAKAYSESNRALADKLLEWLCQHHAHSLAWGWNEPDSAALFAVIEVGPLDLAEILALRPLYTGREVELQVLILVWARNLQGSLRQTILAKLKEAVNQPDSVPILFLEQIAQQAIWEGDPEVYLVALEAVGLSSHKVKPGKLILGRLIGQPTHLAAKAISHLCANPRLKDYPADRAATCAMVLLHERPYDIEHIRQLADALAEAADVPRGAIYRAFAKYSRMYLSTDALSISEYFDWLSARLPLIAEWGLGSEEPSPSDAGSTAAVRNLVTSLCTALRWVVSQGDGHVDDQARVESCLSRILSLVWWDPKLWTKPLDDTTVRTLASTDLFDPIRLEVCARTGQWLVTNGWLRNWRWTPSEDLHRAATREIVRLIFKKAPREDIIDEIESALLNASGKLTLRYGDNLLGSPWLTVLEAIAAYVGVQWRLAWSTGLTHEHDLFPDRLASYFKQLREQLVHMSDEMGWHPLLLELCTTIAVAQGDDNLTYKEIKKLLVPALETLAPDLVAGLPNDSIRDVIVFPLVKARKVPLALADTVASLELSKHGMLRQLCNQMCRRDQDSVWWESVKDFRDAVRQRVSSNPNPSRKWYQTDETPARLVEASLAPINLILDHPPQKKDWDEVCSHLDGRCRKVLEIQLRPEPLEWATEEMARRRSTDALWLTKPLVMNQCWDLLYKLLHRLYSKEERKEWESSFFESDKPLFDATVREADWRVQLRSALGLGPEEGLIYSLERIVSQQLRGTLLQDQQMEQYRREVRLIPGWQSTVRQIFHQRYTNQFEVIRTLLITALLSGNKEPVFVAERLARESSDAQKEQMELDLLWIGRAIAPELLSQERISRIARRGQGLTLLAELGAWEAVHVHLESCAKHAASGSHDKDPLLTWYRQCEQLEPDQQMICLQIFNEVAPQLLMERNENPGLEVRTGTSALLPIYGVSSTLKFYWPSDALVRAARNGDQKLARAWFQAILVEATYGPDRSQVLDRLQSLCRCAGAWLTVEQDDSLKSAWLDYIADVSKRFKARSVWLAFFHGVGTCLEGSLGASQNRWMIDRSFSAKLAFAEGLSYFGKLDEARSFWYTLLDGQDPWLALRACEAFLARRARDTATGLDEAREFLMLAWQSATGGPVLENPDFLSDLLEAAVEARSEIVLEDMARHFAGDKVRAASLGRIALDVIFHYLDEHQDTEEQKEPSLWTLSDIARVQGVRQWLQVLIDDAADPAVSPEDIAVYNHRWFYDELRSELGWLRRLLEKIAQSDAPQEMLSWVGSWIGRVRPDGDKNWEVCEKIAHILRDNPQEMQDVKAQFLDFAIASLAVSEGEFSRRVDLALSLVRGQYRVNDILEILNPELERQGQRGYVDSYLARIAITYARELGPAEIVEQYLNRIRLTETRCLTEDEIAEIRGVSDGERLAKLIYAPQGSDVIDRMARICWRMLGDLPRLDTRSLQTLASVLMHLPANRLPVDRNTARSLGQQLGQEELMELRRRSEEFTHLRARLGGAGG